MATAEVLTLYLVRHGRTRYNAERRVQGWADSELTPDGLEGVRVTATHLREVAFDAVYTSPSGRTLATTAEILVHHPHLRHTAHDGLRELHFGEWEERSEAELAGALHWPTVFGEVLGGTFPGLPGGESAAVYLARVGAAFAEIERAHRPGERVLVVSHGMTLTVYLAMAGVVPERVLANASVSVVQVSGDGVRRVDLVGHDPSGVAEVIALPTA